MNNQSQDRRNVYTSISICKTYRHYFAFKILIIYLFLLNNFQYIFEWERYENIDRYIKDINIYNKSIE